MYNILFFMHSVKKTFHIGVKVYIYSNICKEDPDLSTIKDKKQNSNICKEDPDLSTIKDEKQNSNICKEDPDLSTIKDEKQNGVLLIVFHSEQLVF